MRTTLLISAMLAVIGASCLGGAVQAAEQGTTTGRAFFHAQGSIQEYAPDLILWSGEFNGHSITNSESGVLHMGAWYCTGEQAIRGGETEYADGLCTVTDPEGDKINLRWEFIGKGPDAGQERFRGTYISGSGKYAGIQGYYVFLAEPAVAGAYIFATMVEGEYSIP